MTLLHLPHWWASEFGHLNGVFWGGLVAVFPALNSLTAFAALRVGMASLNRLTP